ncbi:MAG: autotransporter outer membrane beta-barrel domain-containing protein [Rhodospirillaceae bacterium]
MTSWPAAAADPAAAGDETTRITLPSGVSLFVNPRDGAWAPGEPSATVDVLAPTAPAPAGGFGAALGAGIRPDDRVIANGMVAGGYTDRVFGAFGRGEDGRGLGLQVNVSALGAYVTASGQYAQGTLAARPAGRSGIEALLGAGMGPPLFVPDASDGGLDSAQAQAQLTVGYDVNMGAFRFGPFGSLAYSRTQTGDYTDRRFGGGVAYGMDEATARSLRAGVGVTASYVLNTESAVVLPQVRFGWEQAIRDDTRKPGLDFLGDGWIAGDADRGAFNLGFSVGTFMTGGIAGFVDFDVMMNNPSSIDGSAVTFGVRKQF